MYFITRTARAFRLAALTSRHRSGCATFLTLCLLSLYESVLQLQIAIAQLNVGSNPLSLLKLILTRWQLLWKLPAGYRYVRRSAGS